MAYFTPVKMTGIDLHETQPANEAADLFKFVFTLSAEYDVVPALWRDLFNSAYDGQAAVESARVEDKSIVVEGVGKSGISEAAMRAAFDSLKAAVKDTNERYQAQLDGEENKRNKRLEVIGRLHEALKFD